MTIPPDASMMGQPEGAQELIIDLTPKKDLGHYSLNPDEGSLTETAARCIECMRLLEGPHALCPWDPEHTIEPLHTAQVGLGYRNDDDFYNWDAKQFEYPAVPRT